MGAIICLGSQVKSLVQEEIDTSSFSDSEKAELRQSLKTLLTCGRGIPFELGKAEGKTRKKRAPSAYNQFIGQCMKGKKIKAFGEASSKMKECAAEWRKRKGA